MIGVGGKALEAAGSVFRVEPGDRRHVWLFAGAQLDQVGPSIGVDDKVGLDGGPCRLDHDVDASGISVAAFGVTDDPAHGVAGGERPRTDQLLARLERDIRDLPWRGIDLIERARDCMERPGPR